ncbi:MAG: hypothetical protein IT368_02680 [Candidatus Hydrogenedentes bacterium]|nr:hypothetical protein [Candidatus Hydrogenedentota bacterium]
MFVIPLLIVLAAPVAQPPLVYFDVNAAFAELPDDSVLRYDALKFVTALQGLVNRDEPRLAIRMMDVDDYWLGKMQVEWLKDRSVERLSSLEALVSHFQEDMAGAVVWDPAVPATANVAATVCGVEGWLPVRGGSALYERVVAGGPKLPVKLDLTGKFDGSESGSAKCDAYLWAKREYLDQGRCNPDLVAYYVDAWTQRPRKPGYFYGDLCNATLPNHDYYIARRAFFFDLSPWGDETPVDDPGQPLGTDKNTFLAILRAQAGQNKQKAFTSVGGFTPWDQKYTNHGTIGGKHEPVATEWEHASLLSSHNAIMDADALGLTCLSNASAWSHFPLQAKYAQNPRPEKAPLERKTYVLIYMGDYDSAAWLSRHIPQFWDDPVRGEFPIAWAFNPNLAARVPYVFDYIYKTKSANDWFIGGDSGAGYLNPNLLIGDRLGSGLPDALDLWVDHNKRWYGQFDYSITGFVINGFHGIMPLRIQEAYAKFSPDGVGMQLGYEEPIVDGTPFLRHVSDIYPKLDHLDQTAAEMARFARGTFPRFRIYRWILQSPTTMKRVYETLQANHGEEQWVFCDPYTFFDLYKRHKLGEAPAGE